MSKIEHLQYETQVWKIPNKSKVNLGKQVKTRPVLINTNFYYIFFKNVLQKHINLTCGFNQSKTV